MTHLAVLKFIAHLLSEHDDMQEQLDHANMYAADQERRAGELQLKLVAQPGMRTERFREPRCEERPGDYRCRLLPGHDGEHLF